MVSGMVTMSWMFRTLKQRAEAELSATARRLASTG
jgi:hypothetical protein